MSEVILPENVEPRREAIERAKRAFASAGDCYVPPIQGFTCDTCPCAPNCTRAFDDYNTDGDCLAMK